jgi:hypothetical protein
MISTSFVVNLLIMRNSYAENIIRNVHSLHAVLMDYYDFFLLPIFFFFFNIYHKSIIIIKCIFYAFDWNKKKLSVIQFVLINNNYSVYVHTI